MSDNDLDISIEPVAIAYTTDEPDMMIIEVDPKFTDALLLIEEQEHLLILYWMDKLDKGQQAILQVHPRGEVSRPLHGVFAVHSPMRPNPIGVTRVELLKVEGNKLFVKGLDALDSSPVIDIKGG